MHINPICKAVTSKSLKAAVQLLPTVAKVCIGPVDHQTVQKYAGKVVFMLQHKHQGLDREYVP